MGIDGYFEGSNPFVDIHFEHSPLPVKVLVDTGFDGELMLRRETIGQLGLPEIGDSFYITASGAEVTTTIHLGLLKWLGETKRVTVFATEGRAALLGMWLLFRRSLLMKPSDGILRIE